MATATTPPAILLALAPGVGKTGWAVFAGRTPQATGIIALPRARNGQAVPANARIAALLHALDELRERCRPNAAALRQPEGIHRTTPALTLLAAELTRWAAAAQLPLASYQSAQVRQAVAGHPRASQQDLAFAVMEALGLIGARKTPHEWEAIAVGAYHLLTQSPGNNPDG